MTSSLITAEHAFLDGRFQEGVAVVHDRGVIREIRPRSAADPAALPGTLLPGLVNAHLHLELSWAAGQVPGGQGFDPWVQGLFALTAPEGFDLAEPLASLVDAGTAAVCDISNGPDRLERFAAAGLGGVVQRELLGMHGPRLPALLERAAEPPRRVAGMVSRSAPHAVYSTPGPLIRAAVGSGAPHPASIHVSEDLAEHDFLRDGSGTWPTRLDAMGLDWRGFEPPGCTPVEWLDRLGVLGPRLLLVHGVHLTPEDRALVRYRRAPLCLCPRSNLHIGGRLPDVPRLLGAEIPLALGTDSLASSPDLDVLSEIPPLARAFPDVPLETWLAMATAGGADVLGLPWAGRLSIGLAPGLLHVAAPPEALFEGERRWLARPVPTHTPFAGRLG